MRFARAEHGLIGRWPRRLAALACLGLALLAAARQPSARSADENHGVLPGPGQRAVPVSVAVDPRTYLHTGDIVELLAAPAGAEYRRAGRRAGAARRGGRGTRRRAVHRAAERPVGDASWPLVVSVDEQAARQIAALDGRSVLAVLAGPP